MSSAPAPQFDSGVTNNPAVEAEPAVLSEPGVPAEAAETEPQVEPSVFPAASEYIGVMHLTRTWVQYGIFGFAVLCIVIGAVEALFGR